MNERVRAPLQGSQEGLTSEEEWGWTNMHRDWRSWVLSERCVGWLLVCIVQRRRPRGPHGQTTTVFGPRMAHRAKPFSFRQNQILQEAPVTIHQGIEASFPATGVWQVKGWKWGLQER